MKMIYIKHRSGKVMNRFAISAILAAKELGIDFTIANNMSMAEEGHFEEVCKQYEIKMVHIDFDRNPLSIKNVKARKQLLKLMQNEKYDIMHCNTPTGGLIGRICAAQMKTPQVIYMAHGFHFWKGAPIKNWLCYYPVERYLAHFSDRIITINQEDYNLAKGFKYKKGGCVAYVPGVGIEIEKYKFSMSQAQRHKIRTEMGIPDDAFLIISVGELNKNKNHSAVIRALSKLENKKIHYCIAGEGDYRHRLEMLAMKLNVADRVHLLGYRRDVPVLCKSSDVFCLPSLREGLPVSLMEAMASGLPCVASKIRGNIDLLENSELIFQANDVTALCDVLRKAMDPEISQREIYRNTETLNRFSLEAAVEAMKDIYINTMNDLTSNHTI